VICNHVSGLWFMAQIFFGASYFSYSCKSVRGK
jgi:hypothetical protein